MTTDVDSTTVTTDPSWSLTHGPLRVSDDRHSLVHEDGTAFLWLGDTAWELFHRLTIAETEEYLENRRSKGFTVIQAVALAEIEGLTHPTPGGHVPFIDSDPARPVEGYWRHVDDVVAMAGDKGIYIAMLPTWGCFWAERRSRIFTVESARAYGSWLGERYAGSPNVIWVLGGDRFPHETLHFEMTRAMAAGIREGDSGTHLMTYHPRGGSSSSYYHHAEEWLDFNMIQSGHRNRDLANYDMVSVDYNLLPEKPTLDGEPRYENHPINGLGWKKDAVITDSDYYEAYDVRQAAYWALLAGAFGHTYGCHDIWQMAAPDRKLRGRPRGTWRKSLDLPGAEQMRHVRSLIVSRPMCGRRPCSELIAGEIGKRADHKTASLGPDGAYAFVYLPSGGSVEVDLTLLSGTELRAWWYDPRTGKASKIRSLKRSASAAFEAPGEHKRGNDWVLVLDDADRAFIAPGSCA